MNAERLLRLADFLETLPEGRFDYSVWSRGCEPGVQLEIVGGACGTTGCALGWATAIPEFQELGLYLDHTGTPNLKGRPETESWKVTKEIFDLTMVEHDYLFYPECSPPAGLRLLLPRGPLDEANVFEVAAHIRKFVEVASAS